MVPAAAEQGVPEAQFQYALMLLDGRFCEEGPAGRLCADAGSRRGRQPAGAVQFRLTPRPARAGQCRHDQGRSPTTSVRRMPVLPTRNMRCHRFTPMASAARSTTRPKRGACCSLPPGRISTRRSLTSRHGWSTGSGGPRDLKAGFGWMMRAAQAGNVAAQNRLAKLYMGGIGTEPNSIDAAAWYFLARRAGLDRPRDGGFPARADRRGAEAGAGTGEPAALGRQPDALPPVPCLQQAFVVMEAPKRARSAQIPFRKMKLWPR